MAQASTGLSPAVASRMTFTQTCAAVRPPADRSAEHRRNPVPVGPLDLDRVTWKRSDPLLTWFVDHRRDGRLLLVLVPGRTGGCVRSGSATRLLSTFATAGLMVLLARGFGWLVVH